MSSNAEALYRENEGRVYQDWIAKIVGGQFIESSRY